FHFWRRSIFHDGPLLLLGVHLTLFPVVSSEPECKAMHSRASGMNLICCSIRQPVIDSCEYSSLCNTEECQCHLHVGAELSCELDETDDTFVWRDHHQQTEKLSCSNLNLPNREHPYKVVIHHWNGTLTPDLIRGLAEVNVTVLRIYDIDETTPLVEAR
ncbi:hypothetical protein OSTOST_21856, partial [Ostertagia ostertagi]